MSRGGVVTFRGTAQAAENYLRETYLREGKDLPVTHIAVENGKASAREIDGEQFRRWMEHRDPFDANSPVRGQQRGGQRKSPVYHEVLVSSSKSLSLAAAANPRIGEALEAAMDRATTASVEAFAVHAAGRAVMKTRGPQVAVRASRVEATHVQHTSSRGGDPHYHRHVQLLPRVEVETRKGLEWKAVDGAMVYAAAGRMSAAADLAMSTDPELRRVIAEEGYTWEPGVGGGKIAEFEPLVDEFSSRRDQVAAHKEAAEASWRSENPGKEPSAAQVRKWDQLGWATDRPEKKATAKTAAGVLEDKAQRLAEVVQQNEARTVMREDPATIDAEVIAREAIKDLEAHSTAFSRMELLAAIDRRVADTYVLGEDALTVRSAAIEAATGEVLELDGLDPQNDAKRTRFTTRRVVTNDREVMRRLQERGQRGGRDGYVTENRGSFSLSEDQAAAARSITGNHALVVVEGAAGSGKTTMLEAANEELIAQDRRLVAVSPTKRGALEMGKSIGAQATSVHGLLVAAGASFDDRGRWTLPEQWKPQLFEWRMDKDSVLVVDEAGMLDKETAWALHRYADDKGVGSIVLLGDSKQLPAVGRGGYLRDAWAATSAYHDLTNVQRFRIADGTSTTPQIDTEYADASLKLREREEPGAFVAMLQERGQVRTGEVDEVIGRVAETVALETTAGENSIAVASTNTVAQRINRAVYDELVANRTIDASVVVRGRDGDPIAKGARVATRLNDREMDVANRQVWEVRSVQENGSVIVKDVESGHHRTLDPNYVRENVQLAFAVTAHGAQGMTVDTAHMVLSGQTDAAGLYVGLTRGRYANLLHAVAEDDADVLEQFTAAVSRVRGDEGLSAVQATIAREHDKQKTIEAQPERKSLDLSLEDEPFELEPKLRRQWVLEGAKTEASVQDAPAAPSDPLDVYRGEYASELAVLHQRALDFAREDYPAGDEEYWRAAAEVKLVNEAYFAQRAMHWQPGKPDVFLARLEGVRAEAAEQERLAAQQREQEQIRQAEQERVAKEARYQRVHEVMTEAKLRYPEELKRFATTRRVELATAAPSMSKNDATGQVLRELNAAAGDGSLIDTLQGIRIQNHRAQIAKEARQERRAPSIHERLARANQKSREREASQDHGMEL
ncbi:AAA family ATPase [Brachybacterium sp.]|uniref:AAA family ATPase n=1 Tax=Brachybacterium sp. TaxID=1891286 RepID=UPI002ED2639F